MAYRVKTSRLIPRELRRLYGYLSGALFETHDSLHTLEELYGDSSVVDLLNTTAPAFFAHVKEILVRDIILSISRVTDKPGNPRSKPPQENLTLSRLVLELSPQKHPKLHARLEKKWKRIEKLSAPIRTYRHKVIGHADKVVCLKPTRKLGKKISISLIRRTLEKIEDFLNTFDYAFTKGETGYHSIGHYGNVGDFVAYLKKNPGDC